jgi:hypothetical protein
MTISRGLILLTAILLGIAGIVAGCDLFGTEQEEGPEYFYYSDERRIPLKLAEWWKVVQIPNRTEATVDSVLKEQSDLHLRATLDAERGFYWLAASARQDIEPEMIDRLTRQVPVRRRIPSFYLAESDTSYYLLTDEFRVKFNPTVSRADIEDVNAKYGVDVALESKIDSMQAHDDNEYLLRVNAGSEFNALEAANVYYEDPRTEWSVPNSHVEFTLE